MASTIPVLSSCIIGYLFGVLRCVPDYSFGIADIDWCRCGYLIEWLTYKLDAGGWIGRLGT